MICFIAERGAISALFFTSNKPWTKYKKKTFFFTSPESLSDGWKRGRGEGERGGHKIGWSCSLSFSSSSSSYRIHHLSGGEEEEEDDEEGGEEKEQEEREIDVQRGSHLTKTWKGGREEKKRKEKLPLGCATTTCYPLALSYTFFAPFFHSHHATRARTHTWRPISKEVSFSKAKVIGAQSSKMKASYRMSKKKVRCHSRQVQKIQSQDRMSFYYFWVLLTKYIRHIYISYWDILYSTLLVFFCPHPHHFSPFCFYMHEYLEKM